MADRSENKKKAIKSTDEIFWSKHTELDGQKLTQFPKDAILRREWMEIYRSELSKLENNNCTPSDKKTSLIRLKQRCSNKSNSDLEPKPIGPLKSNSPCGISKLKVTCGHNRSAGDTGVLQIVADQITTEAREIDFQVFTAKIIEKYNGSDNVEIEVLTNGKNKRRQLSWKQNKSKSSAAWINTHHLTKLIETAPNDESFWSVNIRPESYNVSGRGCDNIVQSVRIESFPNKKSSIEFSLEYFEEWSKKINKGWEKWGKLFFQAGSPVELKPKIDPPTGYASASWGWVESKEDWRTYYDVNAEFGINPIIGISIELSLSMGTLLYTAAGVPPILSNMLAKHIADILVSIEANSKGSFIGSPHAKFYSTGENEILGIATLSIEGSVTLKITARVGSDYVISASASLSGETKVKGKAKTKLNRNGLFMTPSATLDPLIVEVSVKFKAFIVVSKEKKREWKPWNTIDLYKGKPTKILPLDKKKDLLRSGYLL